MTKNSVLALGLGIVIGAAGMWFVGSSDQPAYEVDEVIEGYSMPSTPMNDNNQAQPVNPPADVIINNNMTPADMNDNVPPADMNNAPASQDEMNNTPAN